MKRITLLLALLAVGWSPALGAPVSTNSAAANRVLLIDPSSTRVFAGKATLTIGPLERTNGVYTGVYKYTVFPWVLYNEKGTLAILVSNESLAEVNQGKVVTVRRDELEEVVEVIVPDVGMDELLAVPIHQADVHLVGVQINSAVELCSRSVIFHSVRQKMPRGTG